MSITSLIFLLVQLTICLIPKDRRVWLLFIPFITHPLFLNYPFGLAVMYQIVAVIFYVFVIHRPFPVVFFTLCSLVILLLGVTYTSLTIVTVFGYAAMVSFLIRVEFTDDVGVAIHRRLSYSVPDMATIKNLLVCLQTIKSAKEQEG
jgi:hypothetical protein